MSGWGEFALALTIFVGTHFLPTRRNFRARLIEGMGRRLYLAVYGIISLAVLIWLIAAAGRAPYLGLWPPAEWQRWVPAIVMPLAATLAALGIGLGYPHTLGGRLVRFDPIEPGIAAATRHPLLWALVLWSLAHVVPNGNLAHVILFGGFAAMSLGAIGVFDRRGRRATTPGEWREIERHTSILSLAPLASPSWWRANGRKLARAAAIGVGVYATLVLLHEPVIGVSPLPH